MKILLPFLFICFSGGFQFILAQPGTLDTSFSKNGWVSTNAGTGNDYANDVAIQPDGKIVVAIEASVGTFSFGMLRYNTDGKPDNSFGVQGEVTTDISEVFSGASAVALQSDGKIVGAGFSINSNGYYDFALIRYLSNGDPDSTFGDNGVVITSEGNITSWAVDVAIQNDGKIIAAGFDYGEEYNGRIIRYNADGTIDSTYGTNGIVVFDNGINSAFISGIALQQDGKVVAAGYISVAFNQQHFLLLRYRTDGTPDSSFGTNGVVNNDLNGHNGIGFSVLVQPDGKLVESGNASNGSNTDFAVTRYLSNGTVDTSFGNNGVTLTDYASLSNSAINSVLQPDGKILLAGTTSLTLQTSSIMLARYTTNGEPDLQFGTNGVVLSEFRSIDESNAVALQNDGKIVSVGSTQKSFSDYNVLVVRYNGGDLIGCDIPFNLTVISLSSTQEKIKWHAVAGATEYTIRYRKSGAVNWIVKIVSAPHTSKKLNGLAPGTTYELQIQTACVNGATSAWSASLFFSTPLKLAAAVSGDELLLLPNPANDHIRLLFTQQPLSPVHVSIADESGRLVYQQVIDPANSIQISVGALAPGLYIMEILHDNITVMKTFIISR